MATKKKAPKLQPVTTPLPVPSSRRSSPMRDRAVEISEEGDVGQAYLIRGYDGLVNTRRACYRLRREQKDGRLPSNLSFSYGFDAEANRGEVYAIPV